jgi:subtilisin family serine protease
MTIKRTQVALALASALFSIGAGAAVPAHHLVSTHVAPQHVNLTKTNPLIGADGKAAVMIVLKGDPATRTYAQSLQAAGRGAMGQDTANKAAKSTILALQAAQNTFESKLQSAGVAYTKMYNFQRVLNGISVRMKPEDMAKVRAMANVERVDFLPTYKRPDNIVSVPFVNAPEVWDGGNTLGLPFNATGTGVKIGDIDTGLDYIHPDFGGTGLLANYQDVNPTSVIGKNSHNVLFPTSKVRGGTDFAGDAYTAYNDPEPDPNPMDCGGHGSHTAGTLAGLGVNADGTPYNGIYNTTVPYAANLKIGPGMAPGADLYALRVFGCGGSTNLVTEAIEWATDPNGNDDFSDHLDVINMSLGSPFGVDIGRGYDDDIEAVNNAALVGLISVSAAGNSGDTFFINGAPGAANVGISSAASVDPSVPGVLLTETTPTAEAFIAAAAGYTNPANPQPPAPNNQTGVVVYANDATGGGHLGCGTFSNAAALSGHFALIDRGTCNFTVKVLNAQAAGATGVIVADTATSTALPFPISMGGAATAQITIPGLSVTYASGIVLKGQIPISPVNVTLTAASAADTLASFSSRGPVSGPDGVVELKPDISAPGLNIPSVQTGYTCDGTNTTGCITPDASGFIPGGQVLTISGTSMATPHIAGMMALLRQLNPDMTVEQLKALAINGAGHDVTFGANATPPLFEASRIGAGRIDAAASATSSLIAFNADVPGAVSVTFDVEPTGNAFSATHSVTLTNLTTSDENVTLALDTLLAAPGVTLSVPGSITIPASGSVSFDVTLTADTTQMTRQIDPTMATSQSSTAFAFTAPRQYLTEQSSLIKVMDGSTELARLPVYSAIRPHSNLATLSDLGPSADLVGTTNLVLSGDDVCTGSLAAGPTCNFTHAGDEESLVSAFELQFTGAKDDTLPGFANLHYVGVNSQPDGSDTDLFFGVATYGKWGSPAYASYNVCIDTDGDGLFDKIVANSDLGTLDQVFGVGGANGEDTFVSMEYDNTLGNIGFDYYMNLYPANVIDTGAHTNNTLVLGALASSLGIAPGAKFTYGLAVCPGYNPLCGSADWTSATSTSDGVGTANCGTPDSAFQTFNGPFTYDPSNPGVDGAGNVLLEDLNGGTIAVDYNANNLSANGSSGMLLLHTHNGVETSAQVVTLDRIFANGFDN